ncbi:chemotaxis protein CheA, partial [Vibrio campbellii]
KAVSNLDVVTADLQGAVMKTRMQPIKKVFGRFPRVVRDLARSLQKDITLEMRGEDTDLDKNLVEALADPLIHLVRNSVDHGIEMPDV